MHLAMVSTYPPQSCGIGTYTSYLVEELLDCGSAVTILTEAASNISSRPRPIVHPCFDADKDYVRQIVSAVVSVRPDVVHIQHEYGIFGFDDRFPELLRQLRRLGFPTVVTLHTVHSALSIDLGCARRTLRHPPPNFDVELYQTKLCELASSIVVHQDRTIRQVLVRQGASPDKVAAIPHGTLVSSPGVARANARQAIGINAGEKLIVALGYFEPGKNYLFLLRELSAVYQHFPQLKVRIGGHIRHPVPETVAYLAQCQQFIAALGMADCVSIISHELTETEMTNLFAAADVACFMYDEDTRSASGALHRALGCGAPVVASRIPKFDELADAADELLVNPRSSGELARLLSRILEDSDFRERITDSLADLVDRTTWPKVAWQHACLYRHFTERDVTGLDEASPEVDERVPTKLRA